MKSPIAPLSAVAIVLLFLLTVQPGLRPAFAAPFDGGRFVVFSRGEPVGTEDFEYETRNDSLFVTAHAGRQGRTDAGAIKPYTKSMEVIARADDWGLLFYRSTERFDGHKINRDVMPSDTAITVVIERDDWGTADRVERLPGRVYVMDAGMFTLFDVIARSLHGRIFGPRPVPLVTLGDQNVSINATATPAGRDTLRWGSRPVLVDHIVLTDSTSTFSLFVSPKGNLLRLENAAVDLVVMREPPAIPAAARRRRPPVPQPH